MEPQVRTSFQTTRPLDLFSTLAAIEFGPSLTIQNADVWRATRTPEGPATVHLQRVAETIEVEAWGPGATWAAAKAPSLCGEEDDATGFQPRHRVIADLHRRNPGLRLPRTTAVFEALVPAVLEQKVTTVEAKAGYRALVAALGEPAPGPVRLTLPPSSQVLARTPYWAFHRFGVERRRAVVIIEAARSANRLEEITNMDLPSAYRRLDAFPGVGPWTAAKVALVALGDPDAVPVGDYHLPHTVGYALEGTPRSSDERMLELLDPYRGHRARVIRLLMVSGIGAPRFGPRRPLRNIANN
ncbi:MAG TPA: DNA-3-methyladenine glycosylase 2 family protein [Candidatus Nitrosotalea sp.]|nr:DNA-3-methyladenine glycosylase 2 family protein [Candidatus Nitrosotalea sp.]